MEHRLSSYVKRSHRFVDGWTPPGAIIMILRIAELQRSLGITGNVAEIGVHHGRLFILLYLLKNPGEKALAIDLFQHQELNVDQSGKGDREVLLANLRKYADTQDVLIHTGDSQELTGPYVTDLAGGPFRLFSIDGGHAVTVTQHDLATAEASLAPGGVIILDDYFNEIYPEVSIGTTNFFRDPRRIVPFAIGGGKVMFCHPDYATTYAEGLRSCRKHVAERTFLGSPVVCLDFAKPSLAVWIGETGSWQRIRETSGGRLLRKIYKALRPYFP
jgi:hypothetical protein